jgi:hypothetical protein
MSGGARVANHDALVRIGKFTTNVIPTRHPGENRGGIQEYWMMTKTLDPGFRRGDDFLRGASNVISTGERCA